MNIFVVVPNWNGADLITECLESLERQSHKGHLVVVDNGSTDDSVDVIEKKFPNVFVIKLPKNTGFSGGVNTGVDYALEQGAEAIALFNNDAVADKDWLKRLANSMSLNDQIGIVTCKLMRHDKIHFDSVGLGYSIWGMPFPLGRNLKDEGQFEKLEEVFAASGGASLYRSEMLREVGRFDQRFFAYYEDVDLSFRAQLAGWKVIYEPKAIAYHHIGATSSKLGSFTRYHATKNFFMLYFKNMPGWIFWKYLPYFIAQSLGLAVSSLSKKGGLTYCRALGRFCLDLPSLLKDRWHIQKSRKTSPQSIDNWLFKSRPPKIPKV